MLRLYNAVLPLLIGVAKLASRFSPKLERGLAGRKALWQTIESHYTRRQISGPRVLVHVASFGELEQAKPVIAALRARWPEAHVHLTFFSPSGYENAVGKYEDADIISYAPLDTRQDVSRFLDITKPDIVLFTRYDVWPNMAMELQRRKVSSVLFSATASEGSGRMQAIASRLTRATYRALSLILVISQEDRHRLIELGVESSKIQVTGDTRFDQVIERKAQSEDREYLLPNEIRNRIAKRNTLVLVVGSSWGQDEKLIEPYLKLAITRGDNLLTIIIPHEPTASHLAKLESVYGVNAIRFSKLNSYNREPIILVDSIGKLFGLYREADIALIGGGFGSGVHNVLEAAVWGVPSIVGPKHRKSKEIAALIENLGCYEVKSSQEFDFTFRQLATQDELRDRAASAAKEFVKQGSGATSEIMSAITPLMHDRS